MAMKRMIAPVGLLLAAVLVGGAGTAAVRSMTPRQLNASAATYDGKTVTAQGVLLHDRCLFQSKTRITQWRKGFGSKAKNFDPKDFDDDGLTLIGRSDAAPGKTVKLTGVFKKDYLDGQTLDMKACGRNAIVLDGR